MPTDYLPELNKSEHKLEDAPAGKWSGFDSKTEIVKLAGALNVTTPSESEKKPGQAEVHSIPDPWAQVMLFGRALFDENHPAHSKVVGEWRGLLAILALREIRNFRELTFQEVGLSEDALRTSKRAKDSFLVKVARCRPDNRHHQILDETTWDSFHVLKWNGQNGDAKAFAMTSPTTLVATGAYYAEVMTSDEVPWFKPPVFTTVTTPGDPPKTQKVLLKGGVLSAPTTEDLSKVEQMALAEWLLLLRTKLSPQIKTGRPGKLLNLLDSYIEDIGPKQDEPEHKADESGSDKGGADKGENGKEKIARDKILLSENKIGLAPDGKGLYALIDRPAKVETKVFSDVMLVTGGGDQKYLLLDQSIALPEKVDDELVTRDARDITFYRDISLATAPRHYPGGEATKVLDGTAKLSYCTKDFFFEPDLVYLPKSDERLDMIPGCLKVEVDTKKSHNCWQFRQALFPITEEAAKLFSPKEWAERCKLTWVSPTEAVLRIKLEVKPVANANGRPGADIGKPTSVFLEKTYTEGFLHHVAHQLPLIGVWPNVQFEDEQLPPGKETGSAQEPKNRWKRYFLFESWRGGAGEARELELRARPLKDGDGVKRLIKHGSEYVQISRLSRFPEVLVCETPSEVEVQNKPNVAKGLLLLNPPERPSTEPNKNAVLGVDFGTTGTSIYRAFFDAEGNKTEKPEPVRLKDRFVRVTASGEQLLRSVTRELFIPAREWSAARILSVYQDLENSEQTSEEANKPRLPITHGHVLFADDKDPNAFVPEKHRSSVRSNLKWGKKEVVAKAARDFIAQLCMQSVLELVCEGAKKIKIRYSYPTAFDDSDVTDFFRTWENVLNDVKSATSVEVAESDEDQDRERNYEAIAAARYFREISGWTPGGGALTLDIGGGTTDIALWNTVEGRPTLLSHSSVLFAGRDMFLAPIHEYPQLLEKIRNAHRYPDPVPEFKEKKADLGDAFPAHVDAHIQMYGDRLMEDTGNRFSEDNPLLTAFLRIIELGLCGVGFYSGLQWGRMLAGNGATAAESDGAQANGEALRQEIKALETASSIRIYVGGNGSKLLHWCGKGRFKKRSDIYKNFSRSLQKGVDVAAPGLPAKEVDVILSDDPKEEVAYGLVQSGRQTDKSPDAALPLAGESFYLDGKVQKAWSDPLDVTSLQSKMIEVGDRQKMMSGPAGRMPVFSAFLESVDERLDPKVLEGIALSVNDRLGEISDDMQSAISKGKEKDLHRRNPVRGEPIFFLALKSLLQRKISELKAMSLKDAGEE
ncbi:MAG TPA: hypothetical protein VK670_04780 [Silvibacterium sp.]|nr:hypothetical protein [Silvibacterium sp.]